MSHWYLVHIVHEGKQPLAVLFAAFAVTFLVIRLSVRMIRAQVKWWPGNVKPGGMHLHHMVFGIVFMLAAGAGGFSPFGDTAPWAEIFSGLFGVGAALVLDEFALVLHLSDVYWSEKGRTSVDAVFLAFAVFGLLLLGVTPFGTAEAARDTNSSRYAAAVGILLNTLLVVITLFKGKVWTGLLGIFLPILALVGSLRLAQPKSAWARWRYHPDSRKARRALRRDDRTRQRFVSARNKLQDALAGRPSS
jgi:hypothetical protein